MGNVSSLTVPSRLSRPPTTRSLESCLFSCKGAIEASKTGCMMRLVAHWILSRNPMLIFLHLHRLHRMVRRWKVLAMQMRPCGVLVEGDNANASTQSNRGTETEILPEGSVPKRRAGKYDHQFRVSATSLCRCEPAAYGYHITAARCLC